ncbi:MAG: hypothetical protein H6509_05640 [Bryobacterales bacterium]|nr:hypothetical protein [Acidobacteriota bacterium]MCB9384076.1 hypothetical protein [Bryobacterales bacterium]
MTTTSKSQAALYLLLVFVAGAAFGFASSQFYSARVAEADSASPVTAAQYRKNLVASLDEDLNLDDEQVAEILEILDDVGDRWFQVRDAMEPEFEAIRQERAERILAVLDPEQRRVYEGILEEREKRREENDRQYRYGK